MAISSRVREVTADGADDGAADGDVVGPPLGPDDGEADGLSLGDAVVLLETMMFGLVSSKSFKQAAMSLARSAAMRTRSACSTDRPWIYLPCPTSRGPPWKSARLWHDVTCDTWQTLVDDYQCSSRSPCCVWPNFWQPTDDTAGDVIQGLGGTFRFNLHLIVLFLVNL